MKKINKSTKSNPLTQFAQNNPNGDWDDFRNHNGGSSYKTIRQIMLDDQHGLCGFCETSHEHLKKDLERVEHFHSKSDKTDPNINWALDWHNVFAVCLGGSDRNIDKNLYPRPENLSCDAYKDHQIRAKKLKKACEGYIINPLEIAAMPNLFEFDKTNGHLKPNKLNCQQWQAPVNHHSTTYELVAKTIEHLNLNCDRLTDIRITILNNYNKNLKRYRQRYGNQALTKMAEIWFRKPWPSFFTTKRCILGQHAERQLEKLQFNG